MKTGVIVFLVVLSNILGIMLGFKFASVREVDAIWLWLVELGTVLAGFGTVFASYVGYLALNNWKSQSKGSSTLNRLLQNQEYIAILCCEFLDRSTSLMGEEKDDMHEIVKKTDKNFAILSRQLKPNTEILEMKKLLQMPRVRIRDSGVLWDDEKGKLRKLELRINEYIARN
ncbi:hypothetical protein L8S15_17590 [Vibrio sp. S/42/10]|uniref:hypothetical protein n=1 Tax=Vibrio sp. S/42/10 TaxID=2914757 RepID=UPI0024697214|nr:hypothetical protein [Vibrio sp. S/42/10]MDH5880906.1 hypothetical protein [Vibrio sp. S/42/10]